MRFGMNVKVDFSGESAARFIRTCAKADLKALRLSLASPRIPQPVLTALAETGAAAAWSLLRITPENSQSIFETMSKADLADSFGQVAALAPAGSLGVILPEGLHFITRVGQGVDRCRFRKEELVVKLAAMAKAIHAHGQNVVLPCRPEDVSGQVWAPLDFDIFEIEQMLSRNLQSTLDEPRVREMLTFEKKPFWLGKAGIVGGYLMPSEQARFVRKLASLDTGADFAFLWSEPGSAKWEWSRDGEMVVDMLPEAFSAATEAAPVLGGDATTNHWKTQQRAQEAP